VDWTSSSTTWGPSNAPPGGFDALTDAFWQTILDENLLAQSGWIERSFQA